MKTIRLKYVILSLLFIATGSFAQTRMNKTFKTSPEVNIELDSRHTNIIIENWDRNEVQLEAYLEGDTGDNVNTEKLLRSWKLDASASRDKIKIISGSAGNMNMDMDIDMAALEGSLSELPDLLGPLMENLVGPILNNIAENPLPPGFAEDMKGMRFDYDAYKKDGDKYMKKWEAEFEKKFGKKYEAKMEKWAEKMAKNSEEYEKKYEAKMEAWSKDFEKDMEAWGEEFGKKMEAWGEQFGKQFEAQMENRGGRAFIMEDGKSVKSKKTIKLKIPRDAKLELNVRHGELKLGSNIKNLKADLSHSRLSANHISGKNTNITAAYSPVKVGLWEYGVLSTQFVKNCNLDKVISIKLDSNSSDVVINELRETGVLSGSFGKLEIRNLGSGFETLNISLENSDLELNIPDTAFNFSFNGMQSSIKHPSRLKLKSSKSYDNEILNGYNRSREGNSNITIKANFSDVLIN